MKINWKRLGWSFISAIIVLLVIRLYFCKYSLSYGLCVLEMMLRYFFTVKFYTLILLTLAIYIIWPVFSRKPKLDKEVDSEKNPILKEKQAFHYSIASLILLVLFNLSVWKSAQIIEGFDAIEFLLMIVFPLFFAAFIIFITSIVKTVKVRATVYGKRSLILVIINSLIVLADIILLLILIL